MGDGNRIIAKPEETRAMRRNGDLLLALAATMAAGKLTGFITPDTTGYWALASALIGSVAAFGAFMPAVKRWIKGPDRWPLFQQSLGSGFYFMVASIIWAAVAQVTLQLAQG